MTCCCHTASNWQSWNANLNSLTPEPKIQGILNLGNSMGPKEVTGQQEFWAQWNQPGSFPSKWSVY